MERSDRVRSLPPMTTGKGAGHVIQTVTYTGCSPARLYGAAVRAVGEIGFAITSRDDATMVIGFRPATPTGSWPYEHMTAAVSADGDGARIVLGGAPVGGALSQMSGWREGHQIAIMVLDRLKSVLPQVPEPTP
jgi:hypothetical protein